ncbi:MAG: rod shape-determining protein [Leptonema illini]|jgi:rod shape-determining protein MreB|uniref:Cell shape-determining protein MreB n=2 Tax=Leptonema illini TaxID=183 RepID=H2CEN5_9LEPT|nr:rod shape-determining protein [Leptonema illini]EHQ06647.1 rod shape-determining protein MreB [Leptonema illini DSM 21528]KAB2933205.1 MAG: rod shape-determining protein [Leptonema illini]PKL30421.1 MAG: rod shape-determining protein [Spirochaetae bacterium HGW-Spirochaetae-10]
MIIDRVYNMFSNDMGIDLGTANTLVYVKGQGIVLAEPSVVAVQSSTGKVLAVGHEAKRMLGRTPGDIMAIRPMKDGVIADFETVEKMIRYFIQKVHKRTTLVKPRLVIGVPSGITEVEKRAVRESAEQAGAREIFLVEEALAAAIGANVPIHEPAGSMVVDIGGGTTEIAVISLGGMVISDSIRVGGDEFDEAIIRYLRTQYNLIIGERMAEDVKLTLGNAFPEKNVEVMELRGRDAISGLPRTLEVDSNEIRKALKETTDIILEGIKSSLEKTPPELAADIVERGIVMTGGGSLLKGLDKYVSKETGVPVFRAENPLICVALGTGRYLEELKNIRPGFKP